MTQSHWLVPILFVLGLCPSSVQASNTHFLPGDAFYHTILTEELVTWIQTEESPVFEYERPAHFPGAFCGNAGYSRIAFEKMPVLLKQNLRDAYFDLRNKYPKRIEVTYYGGKESRQIETNGFHLFFYNEDFNLNEHDLAVKYNEAVLLGDLSRIPKEVHDQVVIPTVPSGLRGRLRDGPTLERFIPDWNGAEHRDAKSVAPLNVVYPDGKAIKTPTLNGGIKCLIVTKEELNRYATSVTISRDHPLQLEWAIQVSEKGCSHLSKKQSVRKWTETPIKLQRETDTE